MVVVIVATRVAKGGAANAAVVAVKPVTADRGTYRDSGIMAMAKVVTGVGTEAVVAVTQVITEAAANVGMVAPC